jgi:hypothetical protein
VGLLSLPRQSVNVCVISNKNIALYKVKVVVVVSCGVRDKIKNSTSLFLPWMS